MFLLYLPHLENDRNYISNKKNNNNNNTTLSAFSSGAGGD